MELSIIQIEALNAIIKTGVYESTRHNDRTKALERLMKLGYNIERKVINKTLIRFTFTAPPESFGSITKEQYYKNQQDIKNRIYNSYK